MIYVKDRNVMARNLPAGSIGAEIGVQNGVFSQVLLESDPFMLHLVDCWEHQKGDYEADPANYSQPVQDEMHRQVSSIFKNDPRVSIHRMYSHRAHLEIGELDWIYLDANHTLAGVSTDLSLWGPHIRPGGCIMGHDFIDNGRSRKMGFGVVQAIFEFCRLNGWKIAELTDEEWSSYKLLRE